MYQGVFVSVLVKETKYWLGWFVGWLGNQKQTFYLGSQIDLRIVIKLP